MYVTDTYLFYLVCADTICSVDVLVEKLQASGSHDLLEADGLSIIEWGFDLFPLKALAEASVFLQRTFVTQGLK